MALDALRVALQGLYHLTPIALAVQGLIEELEKEWRPPEVLGGAGRRRAARKPARQKPDWDWAAAHRAEADRLRKRQQHNMILALVSAVVTEGML